MSTPFWGVRPWNVAHVFNVPLPSLLRMFFFFHLFSSAENVGTQTSPKNTETQKSGKKKKKKKKHSLKARQGHIKQVCKFQGLNSQKRRGHWRLKEFWGLCLHQAVRLFYFRGGCCDVCVVLVISALRTSARTVWHGQNSDTFTRFCWVCMGSLVTKFVPVPARIYVTDS